MNISLIFLDLDVPLHMHNPFQLRPPLGLMYLESVLKQEGHNTLVLDQRIINFGQSGLNEILKENSAQVAGFHVNSVNLPKILSYISYIKKSSENISLIAGGPGALHYRELLKAGCDFVFHSESEESLPQLLTYSMSKEAAAKISGISYFSPSGSFMHNPADSCPDIESLPYPAWNPVSIKVYKDELNPTRKMPEAFVIASRGCRYNCSYCCTSKLFCAEKYRVRRPDDVVSEVEWLIKEYAVKYISFIDDSFGPDPDWVKEFCGLIKEREVKLHWSCILHPLSFATDRRSIFTLMKDSGCDFISFGAQSSSAQVLKAVNRSPSETPALKESLKICRETGIKTIITFIAGLPEDDRDSVRANYDFAVHSRPDFVDFHELRLLPGSELADDINKIEELMPLEKRVSLSRKYLFLYYTGPARLLNLIIISLKKPLFAWTLIKLFFLYIRRMFPKSNEDIINSEPA